MGNGGGRFHPSPQYLSKGGFSTFSTFGDLPKNAPDVSVTVGTLEIRNPLFILTLIFQGTCLKSQIRKPDKRAVITAIVVIQVLTSLFLLKVQGHLKSLL